ncbi:UDP-N-acetylglucosamine 2-epimerase (non-hydrolyzing) [Kribbella sandramycini]|uniref:UDP-N-acetylglucosamine 2-epimerase (Non-hydrolyzing) n=1 Tax=Kribbella sandramycini TaxID=60450 RepID=A0A7Y4L5Z8_9ACTN|nr:UDP-N-acetylglucosamine 2-epimerase (non-hydrolyzing) [Kribbella sandramycini]MBB6565982.1 UDP-N-acetylglucosamine 2-epimerase (non-hydrolyzing) [Kribbella sandramycini]NOL44984.1 UDP-N-acetylglucosamine 2-epimerase (non-hydrolyzing) [Kribbella sandramycini]
MKVLSIVGARPQFVKLAPIAEAFAATDHEHVIVHTGQHYDKNMSDVFFADLKIPAPDVHLGVGSGSHGVQTGAMLSAMDAVLDEHRPDWVLVYGDTNSTVAGALSAVKMHLPVAHLEAGLRSFNRRMPEEHNRVLTDHAADILLAPTQVAMDHLANEGLKERSRLVGDVMTDVCFRVRDAVQDKPFDLPFKQGEYLVATIHRPDNTDDPEHLAGIIEGLANAGRPVVLLAHPRLVAKCAEHGIKLERPDGSLHVREPLAYPEMVQAVLGSAGVVTDSGGLQKEAFLLGRVCTTLRPETEWVETVDSGWNVLTMDVSKLPELAARPAPSGERPTPYGDGHAADRVVAALAE